MDPHAGPPTLLAVDGDQGLLLDDHARVRRLFEAAHDATVVCPGGPRLASVLGSRVVVRGLDGRARWTQRIPPAAGTDQVACLDPDGRRVVVSRGMDAMKSVHLVTRRADRRILRFEGEIPLITPTQLFAEEQTGGLYARSIPSMRIERRYPAVDWASWLSPSPDGRHAAVTTYEIDGPNRYSLLDLTTGTVLPRTPFE